MRKTAELSKNIFSQITYGLYLLTSFYKEKKNGQIVNTVVQVSSTPLLIAVSVNKNNLTYKYLKLSKLMGISIISEEAPLRFIGKWGFRSGHEIGKFKEENFIKGGSGVPIVEKYSIAWFEAQVEKVVDCGSHDIFLAKFLEGKFLANENPLTYKYYKEVLKGKVPESAPTYLVNNIDNSKKRRKEKMEKYQCSVCGYVYDPEKGDPDGGIEPGTAFADIPEDWTCPVCGVGKDQFELVK